MDILQKNKSYILYLLIVGVVAFYFAQMRLSLNWQYPSASLDKLLSYNAKIPFQYRTFLPFLINIAYKIPFIQTLVQNKEGLAFYFEFIFTVALVLIMQKYIYALSQNLLFSKIFSFLILFLLSYNLIMVPGRNLYYPYDIPSVFFFASGVYLLYQRKYLLYYVVFIIATINRETSCFLTIIYLITAYGTQKKTNLALHVGMQFAIWLAIKYLLFLIFKNNPVEPGTGNFIFINQLKQNLLLLGHFSSLIVVLGSFGFAWIPVLLFRRKIENLFVYRSLWIIVPFLFGMMIVGVVTELRIYSELSVIITSSLTLIVQSVLKDK